MPSLNTILKAFTAKKSGTAPRSSAELRADLAAIDMAALEAAVTDLERQRKDVLLVGSDEDLAANDAAIIAANRQAERGQAAVDRLKELIVEAEAREAGEQLEQQATQAQQAGEALGALYAEAESLVAKARTLMSSAHGHADVLRRWNVHAERAGMADRKISYTDPLVMKRNFNVSFR